MLILSKKQAAFLASCTVGAIESALRRGRISKLDAFIDGQVKSGITFKSLADYHGWSEALRDQILDGRGWTEETCVFWAPERG